MKKPPHVQVELITASAALERLAQDLASETVLAVDLETDSYHCYFSRVCLLQFTSSRSSALVDPLALPTLEPLRPVFADARIRKIFHAADYDIRCLHRDFGFEVHSLFDTMQTLIDLLHPLLLVRSYRKRSPGKSHDSSQDGD